MIRSEPGFGRCPSLGYPKNGPTHATARIRHQTRQSSQAFFFERAASSACLVESIFIACVIRCILASGRFPPRHLQNPLECRPYRRLILDVECCLAPPVVTPALSSTARRTGVAGGRP